jgi:hypothetical protein
VTSRCQHRRRPANRQFSAYLLGHRPVPRRSTPKLPRGYGNPAPLPTNGAQRILLRTSWMYISSDLHNSSDSGHESRHGYQQRQSAEQLADPTLICGAWPGSPNPWRNSARAALWWIATARSARRRRSGGHARHEHTRGIRTSEMGNASVRNQQIWARRLGYEWIVA